jgi:hypothetical protein
VPDYPLPSPVSVCKFAREVADRHFKYATVRFMPVNVRNGLCYRLKSQDWPVKLEGWRDGRVAEGDGLLIQK